MSKGERSSKLRPAVECTGQLRQLIYVDKSGQERFPVTPITFQQCSIFDEGLIRAC
ncbi:MAG: hypothetical protein MJK14_11695 [Rivularia sp. ALOHA_DT_140]|nr:hypothetical protein [Rivularia sp. ALOHA_DT_140]